MDRRVPNTGSEAIQLYMRTYYSLLRSSDAIHVETLVESHIAMASSLHVDAVNIAPDVSALLYSALRLPTCIRDANHVLIGQIEQSIIQAGYTDVGTWERVYAPGRRRRMHYNGDDKLLMYVVSRSDIDDLVPILTAYQIEWNKLHYILQDTTTREYLQQLQENQTTLTDEHYEQLAQYLKISSSDVRRLEIVWQEDFVLTLLLMAETRKNISITLISGSLADYRRATANWWDELRTTAIEQAGIDPETRPIFFISSNTHSLVNLLTGFAHRHEASLVQYVKQNDHGSLLAEYEHLQQSSNKSIENFLYYVLGKYLADEEHQVLHRLREEEHSIGITRVPNKHGFEIEAQIIELNKLHAEWFDPRLQADTSLSQSDAIVINIDYPLGMAAYEILSRITERNGNLLGMYVMGKAATLNGRIGDVMIPNVIHDEHSQNTYLFDNCFSARNVTPHLNVGNVLDNQKAVTALGTFLQNPGYMQVFYHEGYTDIEMEGGPYLSAVYEAFRPKRHPVNEIVNLYGVPFDIGFLHYASDTPMKHGQNLGAGSLNYLGVEPTYATAIAILNRIFAQEHQRLIK
jgi:hypothetical protein